MPVPETYKPSDTMPDSKHLRAKDFELDAKWTLTVSDVNIEALEGQDGQDARNKLILSFAGKQKGLVLNFTNQKALESRLGDQPNHWIGAEIVLHRTMTLYGGEMVPAFRIIEARRPSTPPPSTAASDF